MGLSRQPARARLGVLLPATIALWLIGGGGSHTSAAPELPPLSAQNDEVLQSLPEEKPYNVRLHFLRSNERRHDVLFSALRGLGGGYVGVGADQNYTLAAVAGAELLWLIDIDGDVVQWHKIYAALIPAAPTPAELIALIAGGRDTQAKAALQARWPEAEVKVLWPTFLRYRGMLTAHLKGEREVRQRGRPVTWMSDPELYQYIRSLMQARRVIARVGDLHGETTLIAIGAAARRTGHVVRTLYLSNVEQWFRYSVQFRRNLAALPRDDKTVVLRTLARGELTAPDQDRWHFSVQTLDDFLYRMEAAQPPARGVLDLMPEMAKASRRGVRGLSWLGAVQTPPLARIEWAKLPPLRDGAIGSEPAKASVPWEVLPQLRLVSAPREAKPLVLPLVSWQLLPALRGGDAEVRAPAPRELRLLPPLRPGNPAPAASPARQVAWESLPALRDATVAPRRVVPWRRLPPLR